MVSATYLAWIESDILEPFKVDSSSKRMTSQMTGSTMSYIPSLLTRFFMKYLDCMASSNVDTRASKILGYTRQVDLPMSALVMRFASIPVTTMISGSTRPNPLFVLEDDLKVELVRTVSSIQYRRSVPQWQYCHVLSGIFSVLAANQTTHGRKRHGFCVVGSGLSQCISVRWRLCLRFSHDTAYHKHHIALSGAQLHLTLYASLPLSVEASIHLRQMDQCQRTGRFWLACKFDFLF